MLIDLGRLHDFDEGAVRILEIEGKEIGIIRVHGTEFYALRNRCPHMGGPVCEGHLGVKLTGSPGVVDIDADRLLISCAWHHWEFDVRTGGGVNNSRYRVKTYGVRVEGDRVLIDMPRGRREKEGAGKLEAGSFK